MVQEPVELDGGCVHEAIEAEGFRQVFGIAHPGCAKLVGDDAQQGIFRQRAGAHEEGAKAAANGALDFKRPRDILLGDMAGLGKHLAETPLGNGPCRLFDQLWRSADSGQRPSYGQDG